MQNCFIATIYKGKPAIYDKLTRVYYWGYNSMTEANKAANDLNKGN